MNQAAVFPVELRWGDMDAQAHVNNSLYAEYLQEARADLLLSGPNQHLLGGGVVVVGHQISYLRPISFSLEPVRVSIAPVRVGAARFELAYEISHQGRVCALARTVLCPFDFDSLAPRRLTDPERDWFLERVVDAEPLPPVHAPHLLGRGHATGLRTRWGDLDSYGHVNNVKYFDYVQEARVKMTAAADPATTHAGADDPDVPEDARALWLVARQDVDYVVQMGFRPEPYQVLTAPVRLGTTSMVLAAEIVDPAAGGRVHARARTVLVRGDQDGRPVPLSESMRASLAERLVQ